MLLVAACVSDTDSNPTLLQPRAFQLNVPEYAVNNVIDLAPSTNPEQANVVELTCVQPDYGYPAAVLYDVQVTLSDAFAEASDAAEANYQTLPTTHRSAAIHLAADELNNALVQLNGEQVPEQPVAVTVRLRAKLAGIDGAEPIYSNAVTLPAVRCSQPVVTVTAPETMYINGSLPVCAGWSQWLKMAKRNGQANFFTLAYFDEGAEFKVCPQDNWGNDRGFGQVELEEGAAAYAGLSSADEGNAAANIKVARAGWYLVTVNTKVVGKEVKYTVGFAEPLVYVVGVANGGNWGPVGKDWAFTVPADAEGDFVSPALSGGGELRLSVDPSGDFWKSEFTLLKGAIFYREDANVISSWGENMGSDYSVSVTPGQLVHLNFTRGTGYVE